MAAQPFSHIQYSSISSLHSIGSERSELAEVVRQIVQSAVELLRLADCAVALLDDAGINLIFLTTARNASISESSTLPLYQEPLSALAARREILVLSSTQLDVRLQPLVDGTTCTLACLPLLEHEQLLGVLIASSTDQSAFASEHLRVLTLLADQTALAIHNARQAQLVRDANRMKANFLSLVTHELRSPLNTINGYLDLILEGIAGEINEQQQEFIRRARAGSEHLYALLEDLLLAARADAGQLRLNRAPVALEELVAGALEELEVTAQDGHVALETDLPTDLPELLADSVRLQQVLRNLLINALRFTPNGGRVTVSARLLPVQQVGAKEQIEICVRDTGIGIAPEYHKRVFERFFQVPRSEGGRTSGQGLGLTIVKMIVELHGGQVRIESIPSVGCAVLFTLETAHS